MARASTAIVIVLAAALGASSPAAADGLLLFDTCGATERRSYEHPAFHAIRPDGSGFRTLRDWRIPRAVAGCPRSDPAWSPDGRRIAYLEDEPGESIAVFVRVIRRRGGTPRTVALPDGLCCPNSLSWSRR